MDNLLEIIIIGIFFLISAIGNTLKKKAEKERLELEEDTGGQTAKKPGEPLHPKVRSQPKRQLPYAKVAEKTAVPPRRPVGQTPYSSGPQTHRPLPKQKEKPFVQEPSSVSKPVPVTVEKKDTQAQPLRPEKRYVQSGLDVYRLRKILSESNQVRCLIAASEILEKPLALRR